MRMASGQGALGESPELLVPAFEAGGRLRGVRFAGGVDDQHAGRSTVNATRRSATPPDVAARLAIALPYVVEQGTRLITNAGASTPSALTNSQLPRRGTPGSAACASGWCARRWSGRPTCWAARSTSAPRVWRGAGRRRRRHHHRPRRRRCAVPRADGGRARVVLDRLGPAGRGCRRRPPARVLEPGRRRELLG